MVRNPLTRGSALLFRFLSPDKEFTNMFTPDTVGQVAGRMACPRTLATQWLIVTINYMAFQNSLF